MHKTTETHSREIAAVFSQHAKNGSTQDDGKDLTARRLVMQFYWLAQHVYATSTHDSVIFLDLRSDRYFGLQGIDAQTLPILVNGSNMRSATQIDTVAAQEQTLRTTQKLLENCLISPLPPSDDAILSMTPAHHAGLLSIEQQAEAQRRIQLGDILNFLVACLRAKVALRLQSLEAVVHQVATRKQRAGWRGLRRTNIEDTAELVSIFQRLRPIAFSADGKCLFHALALIHFLAHYGSFPLWVIGVRSTPFAAHSWVQEGDLILDATPESIGPYQPILAI